MQLRCACERVFDIEHETVFRLMSTRNLLRVYSRGIF